MAHAPRPTVAIITIGSMVLAGAPAGFVRAQISGAADPPLNRVVHHFDFDERDDGNLEDVPKFWEPLRPDGFPHYAHGSFDFEVGRSAPPSFHLRSEGRNVAYQYVGPDTRVRANSNYRIEGYIRTDRLTHARACLSAHFLDIAGRPLPDTLTRTRFVGGPADEGHWVQIELFFHDAPPEAHTIGLIAWVLQQPMWSTSHPSRWQIPRRDVHGGAWFDDVTIYALPRVQISTGAPGNVLTSDSPQELRLHLADETGAMLEGRVSITAADGRLVYEDGVPVSLGDGDEPYTIPVGQLPPGLYRARLDVLADGKPIMSRDVAFARAAPLCRDIEAPARPFGVVLDSQLRCDPETELALLREQRVRSAKVPIWTAPLGPQPTPSERGTEDRLLQSLGRSGFALTGVLYGPPQATARADGVYVPTLTELLSGNVDTWRDQLAAVVAPHASTFRWWQIGPDHTGREEPLVDEDELAQAASQLREVMRPFVTIPHLTVPGSTAIEPSPTRAPVEQVTLAPGSDTRPDTLASQIAEYRGLGYGEVSVYIEPLPEGKYQRLPRLADWARRILLARHAGADTVYVPQTWRVRPTLRGSVAEPTDTFLVFRTIADVLADAWPGQRVRVGRGIECVAFHDDESTTLAIWDPLAPADGTRLAIQLGNASRQIDVWGVVSSLARDEIGRQIVNLSPMPVFIPGVDRWLIDFRTSLVLVPDHVESGTELTQHRIEMASASDRMLAGRITFDVPEGWDISPRAFSFSVTPPDAGVYPVELRYPHSEPAGEKTIVARILFSGDSYYQEVPIPINVGVSDLDVSGLAVVERDGLVLRQVVTNRSSEVLSFRASASVPGRERQYRPILNLKPGGTQTVEYHFADGNPLIGRRARLALREVNDGPRVHNLELTIP